MNKNTKARITTLAAGAAVLAVFSGGSAVAGSLITSAQIKDNTIRSADVMNGGLRGVDVKDGSLRGADIADGSLRSADIADGTVRGTDIADGSLSNADVNVFYAAVNADGTLGPNSGGVTVNHQGIGHYVVDFGRPVGNCAFSGTAGSPVSAAETQGEVDVNAMFLNFKAVRVSARIPGGSSLVDIPFMLTAVC